MTWQPIETAPRDGKVFLAARFMPEEDADYEVGSYAPRIWDRYEVVSDGLFKKVSDIVCEWDGFNNVHRMTHWMPVPSAPEIQQTVTKETETEWRGNKHSSVESVAQAGVWPLKAESE